MVRLPILLLFPVIALAQIEIGVRIDAPVVGPMTTRSYAQLCSDGGQCGYFESTPYHPAVGLSASVPLTRRFRLRFDPTYQRIGFTASFDFAIVSKNSTTANRWQIPALLEAGVTRHVRFGIGSTVSVLTDTLTLSSISNQGPSVDRYSRPLARQTIAGAAASIEFPFRVGPVTLAPDLRYTRWFAGHFGSNWRLDELTAGVAIRFSR